ncbi:hypothetical protein [Microbacterium sp.]|uniref:Tc toxin subunit A-related protein n=1 Tax=Microbacterium sp. TaxID=51671 RepID=UPI002E2FD869|nr:hypothetical protein [Microbacterium sp.]HEX5728788.1 hypothetical protein [Microbacterium sp.]
MARSIQHAANFITTMDVRPLRYADLTVNPANSAAMAVEAIRGLLREASDAAARGNHGAALRHYKNAQASCYALLNPAVKPIQVMIDDRIRLPLGRAVESAFTTATVKLMEVMRPDVVAPQRTIVTEPLEADVNIGFTALGFRPQSATLAADIDAGTRLLAQGDAAAAIPLLEGAAADIGDDEPAIRAVALLNLSTALLGVGSNDRAAEVATRAAEVFESTGDTAGAAQALHSSGIAAARRGDQATAEAQFAVAKERLATLSSSPIEDGEPAVGGLRVGHRLRAFGGSPVAERLLVGDGNGAAVTFTQPLREFLRGAQGTDDVSELAYIGEASAAVAPLRWLDRQESFVSLPIDQLNTPVSRRDAWTVGIPVADRVVELQWRQGADAPFDTLVAQVYEPRKDIRLIPHLVPPMDSAATTASYLTHLYAFVIPMGIGDSYQGLGDYARAEEHYLDAAGYTYLNPELEAPGLWVKLARNTLLWGDSLFKYERVDEARDVYAKVAREDGTTDPAAPLYATASLAAAGAVAATVLADPDNVPETVNPAVAELVLTVLARWANIRGGLDFFGLTNTPTFTFEYLQQVARGFAQQAIQAEREYINFTVQAEAEASARRDLESALALAQTEAATQQALAKAAARDAAAAQRAVEFARVRLDNAERARVEYESAGYWQYTAQSIATAHGAGKDWYESEIRELAQEIESGSWSGDAGKLAAAATLIGGQKSYEYQLSRMDDQIREAQAGLPIADAQRDAANARAQAASYQAHAANQRRAMVADALNAFDDEVFTPELWTRMAGIVRDISRAYQYWAIAGAKLMERAYNFETDSALSVIRPEYSVPATGDLLGSDLLLRDIDSFTYHFISAVAKKESPAKEVLSLRNEYPFAFRDFLTTGTLSFDTSLYDFDRRHPGTYGQRLEAIEVEIVGLLPAGGVRGTLRGGGISYYRTEDGGQRTRVHGVDTMVLSDYTLRGDAYVFRADVSRLGLFEGHGIATSWELTLPPGSNNLDYRLISDVQLVLYYSTRHSDDLRNAILAAPLRPGEDIHVRDFALRYDVPEAWFGMLQTGTLAWRMSADSFPRNETQLETAALALVLEGAEGVDLSGIDVTIDLPGEDPVTLTTDAAGSISADAGNALADAMGDKVLGDWRITIEPPQNSPLRTDRGGLDPTLLRGATLVLQYRFDYRK